MTYRLSDQEAKRLLCLAVETSTQQITHRTILPRLELFGMQDLFFGEKTPMFVTGQKSANHFAAEGNYAMSLLLLETFFLCKTTKSVEEITVVYVGAYPGDHINHLSEMFPHVSFRLYDKRFGERNTTEQQLKVRTTNRVRINVHPFTDTDARNIASEFSRMPNKLYYISLLRDSRYKKGGSIELNSDIIDSDMWQQLHWAQLMKPEWSLIRYRPKLEAERPPERETASGIQENVSIQLTEKKDPVAKRRLYYRYPLGYFLRMPMAKKNPVSMFLMTCASETSGYTTMRTYYHDDMISLCRHQNEFVRRVSLYMNPYTNTFFGVYGLDRVRDHIAQRTDISEEDKSKIDPLRYICGAGWDHRAMLYIMTLYARWRHAMRAKDPNVIVPKKVIADEAIELILRIFISMEIVANRSLPEQPSEASIQVRELEAYIPTDTIAYEEDPDW